MSVFECIGRQTSFWTLRVRRDVNYDDYKKMYFSKFSESKIFREGEAFLCIGTENPSKSVTKGIPIVTRCFQVVNFRHKSSSRRKKIDSENFEKLIFS